MINCWIEEPSDDAKYLSSVRKLMFASRSGRADFLDLIANRCSRSIFSCIETVNGSFSVRRNPDVAISFDRRELHGFRLNTRIGLGDDDRLAGDAGDLLGRHDRRGSESPRTVDNHADAEPKRRVLAHVGNRERGSAAATRLDAQPDTLIAQTGQCGYRNKSPCISWPSRSATAPSFSSSAGGVFAPFGAPKRFAAKAAVEVARKCLRVSILVVSLLKVLTGAARLQACRGEYVKCQSPP